MDILEAGRMLSSGVVEEISLNAKHGHGGVRHVDVVGPHVADVATTIGIGFEIDGILYILDANIIHIDILDTTANLRTDAETIGLGTEEAGTDDDIA